jgi:hypothetical protein
MEALTVEGSVDREEGKGKGSERDELTFLVLQDALRWLSEK